MKPVRPNFDRPPLVEQAITVAFDKLEAFSLGDFGLFWTGIRDSFPTTETQQPLDQKIEEFDTFRAPTLGFKIVDASFLPRCFYHGGDGRELVQVQSDRFTFNWRLQPGDSYPKFETTMARFRSLFDIFREFVSQRGLGQILIRQCELTNVNIVPVSDFGSSFADAPKVFTLARLETPADFPLESYTSATQHLILADGNPIGRAYMQLNPVLRIDDEQQAYKLEITARGAPGNDVGEFFDHARSAINSLFLGSTTPWARTFWGENRG